MAIFYIGDLHLGHANIINLCYRPFLSVEEMDTTIINNWNSRVKPTDDIYILGDFSFRSNTSKAISYLKRLNGRKHLIEGNHDIDNLKNEEFRRQFVSIDKYLEIYDNGEKVCLFHYPIAEWNGYFKSNVYHVFGHVHNGNSSAGVKFINTEPRAFNAGVDVNDFLPVTLNEMKNKKRTTHNEKVI